MHQVIKRINPPQSRAAYFAALREQKTKAAAQEREEQREKQHEQKPIKSLATAFLRREERSFDRCSHVYREQHKANIRQLAKLLPGKGTPAELWEVCFKAKDEPGGKMHGPGIILVIVDPRTGNCAIAP